MYDTKYKGIDNAVLFSNNKGVCSTKREHLAERTTMRKVRRILMYHLDDICYNSLNEFTDLLAQSFIRKGIDVGFVNINKSSDDISNEYSEEISKGIDAAIAFNSRGQEHIFVGEENAFEYLNIPYFNWVVDHPCEYMPNVKEPIKNYQLICIDRDHADYARRYYSDISGVHFIPIGGKSFGDISKYTRESFDKRKFDVVFTGSHVELDEYAEDIKKLPGNLPSISLNLIECMLDDRSISTEYALKKVLKDMNIEVVDEKFKYYMFMITPASFYLRAYIREEIIRYLVESGIKIDLFGVGWDKLGDLGNITYHGEVPYLESAKLCTQAKISLNIMPLFRNGIHDRIPTAMLAGSAVMTDTSGYIEETFNTTDNKELLIFDAAYPELLSGQLTQALSDTDSLYAVANRGMNKAMEKLSWDKRADKIIKLIESL